MYALFDRYAARYDLHTPPRHYQHDHAFVLDVAGAFEPPCRLLDVGCGTGVLVKKALRAAVRAEGIDSSVAMIAVARARVGESAVRVCPMQQLVADSAYDLIVALSWTVNYCAGVDELFDVLTRMRRALTPRGRILLQVAHAAHVDGEPMQDSEPGPTGIEDDVTLRYRFAAVGAEGSEMQAEYSYSCRSLDEHLSEAHLLRATDARGVAQQMRDVGFERVEVYDSWRRDPFHRSASPFIEAARGGKP